VWKPMHLQPAFRDCTVRGGEVAALLFEQGLCLPSGSSLSEMEQGRVISALQESRVVAGVTQEIPV
jgi:dTDP-4-amino-4,6-dideoxygalactose transaminase